MGYEVKAMYKEALAHYNITGKAGCCVATLLAYSGQAQNRPPARFIVIDEDTGQPGGLPKAALADDISQSLAGRPLSAPPDPLFPQKTYRHQVVDLLV